MFRLASLIGFAVAILIAVVFKFVRGKDACFSSAGKDNRFIGFVKILVVVFGMLSSGALIVTGFGNRLVFDGAPTGYMLMVHAIAAPVFMMCVAAAAVLWSDGARLSMSDFSADSPAVCERPEVCVRKRIGFWAVLVLSLPVFFSIILSMLPVFGTHMQDVLFEVHRWCALLLAMVIIVESS
ncbi:MAG TPA: hypothetical protein ENH94_05805 [Phycisphaerales bacterium]|nr:hypothetical protein [Phycisphaerales bacterium]